MKRETMTSSLRAPSLVSSTPFHAIKIPTFGPPSSVLDALLLRHARAAVWRWTAGFKVLPLCLTRLAGVLDSLLDRADAQIKAHKDSLVSGPGALVQQLLKSSLKFVSDGASQLHKTVKPTA